jgi:hypothetical protein
MWEVSNSTIRPREWKTNIEENKNGQLKNDKITSYELKVWDTEQIKPKNGKMRLRKYEKNTERLNTKMNDWKTERQKEDSKRRSLEKIRRLGRENWKLR